MQPLPQPDNPVTAAYWESGAAHEFVIPWCDRCSEFFFPPRPVCPRCGDPTPSWGVPSGRGTVYSYTIARRPTHPAFADRVPYAIAIVELDEGPRLTTTLVDCDPDQVSIEMAVEVIFDDVANGVALPVFRPLRAERPA